MLQEFYLGQRETNIRADVAAEFDGLSRAVLATLKSSRPTVELDSKIQKHVHYG